MRRRGDRDALFVEAKSTFGTKKISSKSLAYGRGDVNIHNDMVLVGIELVIGMHPGVLILTRKHHKEAPRC